jgi:hypothetical protein
MPIYIMLKFNNILSYNVDKIFGCKVYQQSFKGNCILFVGINKKIKKVDKIGNLKKAGN